MEMMSTPVGPAQWSVAVSEPTQVAEARRRAVPLAQRAGLDETRAGALALIVTEAATNLVKHARQGELIVRLLDRAQGGGVEVVSLDRGPGMDDLQACFRDGFSSAGTSGNGLGAIRRQADEFDIYSRPGSGTVFVARVRPPGVVPPSGNLEAGVVCLPVHGETESGDGWLVTANADVTRAFVVDGLGHGPGAAEAAAAAIEVVRDRASVPLVPLLEELHGALHSTRGAVAAMAELDASRRQVRFAGVGNIAAVLWRPGAQQSLVSMNGTLGHGTARVREFTYPWPPGAMLIAHSDGLQSRWSLDAHPGLPARDPGLVASVLYRDFSRGRDDVTVLVLRERTA
jgi:anti-sigma regulatory factor (Ser/Thr protein kinase)